MTTNDTSIAFDEQDGVTKVTYYVNDQVEMMMYKDTKDVRIQIEPAGEEIYVRIDDIQIWAKTVEYINIYTDDWFYRVI